MRKFVAAAACVALAACGGTAKDEKPTPDDTATNSASPEPTPSESKEPAPAPKKVVQLTTTGLKAGADAFNYEAGRNEVEAALKTLLGNPTGRGPMEECGAGPMDFTDYAGGVTVNFQDGKLVGWNWGNPRDGDPPAKAEITIAGPVKLGSPRAAVEATPGFERFDDSTLGDEFMINDNLFGFFEAGKVSMLYSGTQCFFR